MVPKFESMYFSHGTSIDFFQVDFKKRTYELNEDNHITHDGPQ